MSYRIQVGDIKNIEYVLASDVESLLSKAALKQKTVVTLKSGKEWQALDYLPETAGLNVGSAQASSSVAFPYTLFCDLDGVTRENMLVVESLLKGKYLVRFEDLNGNRFLMGNLHHTGKWMQSGGKVGKSMPEDNEIRIQFQYSDKIQLQLT